MIAALCEPIIPADDLCALGNLPPGSVFVDLPARPLRVEVAAWSADVLAAAGLDGECPEGNLFDLAGRPLVGLNPQPAFAGASYFDASSAETLASVRLSCPDPGSLNTSDCAPFRVQVRASPIDLETPPEQDEPASLPSGLLVRMAGVSEVLDGDGLPATEVDNDAIVVLEDEATGPTFAADIFESELPSPICVLTLEQTPEATTSIVCGTYNTLSTTEVSAATLPKSTLDEILAAIDLSQFPERGLVIGRVYDELTGEPLAGVQLIPELGGTIEYLNSTRDDTLSDRTFDNGYFIATDVPFNSAWTATTDDYTATAELRGGLVRNVVTLLLVPMRDTSGLRTPR